MNTNEVSPGYTRTSFELELPTFLMPIMYIMPIGLLVIVALALKRLGGK